MPTFLRMMEILACSMAGFLPYILLVIYPFRNHMRLKGYLAGLLTLPLSAGVLCYDILAALGTAPTAVPFPLMRAAALLVLAVLSIHAPIYKVVLNTCSVINLSVLIGAVAGRNAAPYSVSVLLATLGLQALLLIPYAVNLAVCLAPTLNCSDAPVWKLLWIAPAAGTAVACILLLTGAGAQTILFVMAAALLLAAAVSAVILYKTKTEMITLIFRKNKNAEPDRPVAAVQEVSDPVEVHYNNLQTRMAESEHSCKEMLLQVMSMEDDLEHQDYEQLRNRLNTLRKQLAPDVQSTGNKQIDPVITYYTRQAMLSGIKMVSSVTLPEMSSVSDADLAVLFGCLLDNALDACREQSAGTRRIALATYQDDDLLQIGIKNTYGEPMDEDTELLNICRGIAARYDGRLVVIDQKGAAQIVVTLNT